MPRAPRVMRTVLSFKRYMTVISGWFSLARAATAAGEQGKYRTPARAALGVPCLFLCDSCGHPANKRPVTVKECGEGRAALGYIAAMFAPGSPLTVRRAALAAQIESLDRALAHEILAAVPPPGTPVPESRGRRLLHSRALVVLTSPVIWACVVPLVLLDLAGTLYQAICFPIYGIPKVRRRDYLVFDRHPLDYLSFADKFNCEYCAYANGILAYYTEIAARTEQYWCPIKHAQQLKRAHSRYEHFLAHGDAAGYRARFSGVRRAFADLLPAARPAAPATPPAPFIQP